MNKKYLIATLLLATVSASSYAVDIPKELLGKWAYDCKLANQAKKATDLWSGIDIGKAKISWSKQFCTAQKVAVSGNRFTLNMQCTPHGDEDFKATYIFDLSGNLLKESDPSGKWANTYTRCQ